MGKVMRVDYHSEIKTLTPFNQLSVAVTVS
jgi:hypothetical protein